MIYQLRQFLRRSAKVVVWATPVVVFTSDLAHALNSLYFPSAEDVNVAGSADKGTLIGDVDWARN